MDIGVTISKVRKEYREYLRETHPDWADTTISTHVSDAFYLLIFQGFSALERRLLYHYCTILVLLHFFKL